MAEVNMNEAKAVYQKVLKMLDSMGWKYERHDEELFIKSGYHDEDVSVAFFMRVIAQSEAVQFLGVLPFNMPEDKRIEGAVAVCTANYGLVNGSYDYDITDGEIRFRLTTSYHHSTIGEDLLKTMMFVALSTMNKYNDRFLMLSKGMITVQQFMEQEER